MVSCVCMTYVSPAAFFIHISTKCYALWFHVGSFSYPLPPLPLPCPSPPSPVPHPPSHIVFYSKSQMYSDTLTQLAGRGYIVLAVSPIIPTCDMRDGPVALANSARLAGEVDKMIKPWSG